MPAFLKGLLIFVAAFGPLGLLAALEPVTTMRQWLIEAGFLAVVGTGWCIGLIAMGRRESEQKRQRSAGLTDFHSKV